MTNSLRRSIDEPGRARRRGDFRTLGERTKMDTKWHWGFTSVTQVMAIAVRAQEGWPIEAVLADVITPRALSTDGAKARSATRRRSRWTK
jgi:hypothetical protein